MADCRLSGNIVLTRDLIMLMVQDDIRNLNRKANLQKKAEGKEVKLGRRAKEVQPSSSGTSYLTILTIRC